MRTKTSWYFTKMEVSSERASSETSYCQIYYFVHEICVQRARTLGRYATCRRVQYTTFDVKSSSSTGQGRTPNVYRQRACNDNARIYGAHGWSLSSKRFAGCTMCHFPSRFRPFRLFVLPMSAMPRPRVVQDCKITFRRVYSHPYTPGLGKTVTEKGLG